MNCPECDELKETYTKCIRGYMSKRLPWSNSGSSGVPDTDDQCEQSFKVRLSTCRVVARIYNSPFVTGLQRMCGNSDEIED